MEHKSRLILFCFAMLAFSQAYVVGSCQLELFIITDTSYCNCTQSPVDTYPVCHGGGSKTLTYHCEGPSSCTDMGCGVYICTADLVITEVVLWSQTPNCNDTGWWPTGPECNEASDCEITGWTDTYGPHSGCSCQLDA